MINLASLQKEAESELFDSLEVKRTIKIGILYSVMIETLRAYTKSEEPRHDATALSLLKIMAKTGALTRMISSTSEERPSDLPGVVEKLPPKPEEDFGQAMEYLKTHLHMTEDEIQALQRAEEMIRTGGQPNFPGDDEAVIARTDEDLAQFEAEQYAPFPGVSGFDSPNPDNNPLTGFDPTTA